MNVLSKFSFQEHNIVDNKAVRERIQSRVLSSVHQPLLNKVDDNFHNCEVLDIPPHILHILTPVKYKSARTIATSAETMVLECTEFRKRELNDIIARKKF